MYEQLYLKSPNHDVITVYVAASSSPQKMIDLLKREEPIVQNIKSRVTRQAIETAFQKVKSFLANPPASKNGYIIVASESGFAWTDEVLVNRDWYRCGNDFFSSPLEETLASRLYPIGIITVDTQEATIARITNKVEIIKTMTSGIEGKHSKGGQSQRRFERKREQEKEAFFIRIADAAKALLTSPIEEVVLAGPGQTKDEFLKAKYLDYRLKDKVKNIIDTQYTGEHGIRETLHKALPLIEKNAYAKEVKVVEDLFNLMFKDMDRVVYGNDQLFQALPRVAKIVKLEEITGDFPGKEVIVIRYQGEHYDKLKGLGGVVGIYK
jgi:peptide chain release factor subunit 1